MLIYNYRTNLLLINIIEKKKWNKTHFKITYAF